MTKNYNERIRLANDELLGKGNMSVIDDVFASDYVAHADSKDHKGLVFVGRYAELLRAAIPDLRVMDVTIHLQAGNRVAWQRTLSGTHKANMAGIPPSGKKVTWTDMVVSRFDGEKIAEDWVVSDLAGQLMLKLPRE